MAIRYGDRSRVSTPVFGWLNNQAPFATIAGKENVAIVNVAADATPHTKGAWVQLVASTSEACNVLAVTFSNQATGTATQGLIDIGVGASGSEQVVISNSVGGAGSTIANSLHTTYWFPVSIPAGSRIAARHQNVIGSRISTINLGLLFISTNNKMPSSLDTYGADTSTSVGVTLTSNNTYYEMTSSTSQAYQAIVMVPQGSTATITATTPVLTLGMGAASSEVDLGTSRVATLTTENVGLRQSEPPFIYWGHIPQGVRLAVKSTVGQAGLQSIIFGVPYA